MIALRLFRQADMHKAWQDVPVSGYMPVFAGDTDVRENIRRRVWAQYLKPEGDILKVYCHDYKTSGENGFWVERSRPIV